jgi:hypothetical protein
VDCTLGGARGLLLSVELWPPKHIGDYQRFADGVQTCEFLASASVTTSTAFGNIFISALQTLPFPIAFISTPNVSPAVEWAGSGSVTWGVGQDHTSTQAKLYAVGAANNGTGFPGYTAKGHWAA